MGKVPMGLVDGEAAGGCRDTVRRLNSVVASGRSWNGDASAKTTSGVCAMQRVRAGRFFAAASCGTPMKTRKVPRTEARGT